MNQGFVQIYMKSFFFCVQPDTSLVTIRVRDSYPARDVVLLSKEVMIPMRNIVEQLWYNDFSPSDAVPDTDAYIEAKRKHEKAYDDLAGKLPPDQLKEVEELIGHVMDQYEGIIVEAFRQGLKFGIELMTNLKQ